MLAEPKMIIIPNHHAVCLTLWSNVYQLFLNKTGRWGAGSGVSEDSAIRQDSHGALAEKTKTPLFCLLLPARLEQKACGIVLLLSLAIWSMRI